jgi:hypothetical protein
VDTDVDAFHSLFLERIACAPPSPVQERTAR